MLAGSGVQEAIEAVTTLAGALTKRTITINYDNANDSNNKKGGGGGGVDGNDGVMAARTLMKQVMTHLYRGVTNTLACLTVTLLR